MKSLKNTFRFERYLFNKGYIIEEEFLLELCYWLMAFDDNQFENIKSLIGRGNYETNKAKP
jgi:hypothetical protein